MALQQQVEQVRLSTETINEGLGIQVEFESFPGIELAFESLARERSGIEPLVQLPAEVRTESSAQQDWRAIASLILS